MSCHVTNCNYNCNCYAACAHTRSILNKQLKGENSKVKVRKRQSVCEYEVPLRLIVRIVSVAACNYAALCSFLPLCCAHVSVSPAWTLVSSVTI